MTYQDIKGELQDAPLVLPTMRELVALERRAGGTMWSEDNCRFFGDRWDYWTPHSTRDGKLVIQRGAQRDSSPTGRESWLTVRGVELDGRMSNPIEDGHLYLLET